MCPLQLGAYKLWAHCMAQSSKALEGLRVELAQAQADFQAQQSSVDGWAGCEASLRIAQVCAWGCVSRAVVTRFQSDIGIACVQLSRT